MGELFYFRGYLISRNIRGKYSLSLIFEYQLIKVTLRLYILHVYLCSTLDLYSCQFPIIIIIINI